MFFKQERADWLIVGLGNPGAEYVGTRHNAGFKTVDALGEELGANYWKTECGCLTAKVKLDGMQLVLAKPQSFMNLSGGPVKKACAQYGVQPDHLVVIHDELDIPAGDVRVKFGGGHAGHNGLRSICDTLGTRDWHRVRVGIGRPPGKMNPADFVLSVPKAEALETFEQAVETAASRTREVVRKNA